MEPVVMVALGVLFVILLLSLSGILLLLHRRYCRTLDADERPILKYSTDKLCHTSNSNETLQADGQLHDIIALSPTIATLLKSNDFAYDSGELFKMCLHILTCAHEICVICEQTVTANPNTIHQDMLETIRESTGCVMPRVDDLLRTMKVCSRRGIQATVLEARSCALAMSLSNLVTECRYACTADEHTVGQLTLLKRKLAEIFDALDVLREASFEEEERMVESVHIDMAKQNGHARHSVDQEQSDTNHNVRIT